MTGNQHFVSESEIGVAMAERRHLETVAYWHEPDSCPQAPYVSVRTRTEWTSQLLQARMIALLQQHCRHYTHYGKTLLGANQEQRHATSEVRLYTTRMNMTDFTGDVITRPSLRVLAAIIEATLGDDVFREDRTTLDFEQHVAEITGREAGMFVVTGTMANQLSLHTLTTTRPAGVMVAHDSHSINFEGGGPSVLSGAMVQPVVPSNGLYLRVEDLEEHAIVNNDDVHKCPTEIISMENTAGGVILPLWELERISKWAKENNVKTHLDGARLFEAVAAGAGSLRDYCTLVDVVSVDFSKNLGAPMGAMVLADASVIRRMRRTRKAIGGGMRQGGLLTAAAREALFENFGTGAEIQSPVLRDTHRVARVIEHAWISRGGRITRPVDTNIVWLDIDAINVSQETLVQMGRSHGVLLDTRRVVCHHQIDEQAVLDIVALFDQLLSKRKDSLMN